MCVLRNLSETIFHWMSQYGIVQHAIMKVRIPYFDILQLQ